MLFSNDIIETDINRSLFILLPDRGQLVITSEY